MIHWNDCWSCSCHVHENRVPETCPWFWWEGLPALNKFNEFDRSWSPYHWVYWWRDFQEESWQGSSAKLETKGSEWHDPVSINLSPEQYHAPLFHCVFLVPCTLHESPHIYLASVAQLLWVGTEGVYPGCSIVVNTQQYCWKKAQRRKQLNTCEDIKWSLNTTHFQRCCFLTSLGPCGWWLDARCSWILCLSSARACHPGWWWRSQGWGERQPSDHLDRSGGQVLHL